eukprot:CAMPEP_0113878470 /NCGR_PEP_ID=MMETSP0780_2-20120614/6705_1 /TAXON_ID=652834 /ORGANISM="Palpitomonas bilix" /LENGTH=110 /DNA_ID=CAMNT_0000864953 /DNA_START=143 /DNA_END=472 /DNA_ORIENTATION=- /assembly_acc=CAM_ASM_000599
MLGGAVVITPSVFVVHQNHKKGQWAEKVAANDETVKKIVTEKIRSYLDDIKSSRMLSTCSFPSTRARTQYIDGEQLFDDVKEYKKGTPGLPTPDQSRAAHARLEDVQLVW